MKSRIAGFLLIFLSLLLGLTYLYRSNNIKGKEVVFSPHSLLSELWLQYKQEFLESGTLRTLDKSRDNITTSEGQGYTMLRAVWMDDRETFDKSWSWTKDNLQRNDKLFSWLFGKKEDGSFGVLTEKGGQNSASDADTDIALSLLFAYSRWGDKKYLDEANAIIDAIWEIEVVEIEKKPVLVANNLEKNSASKEVLVNPSYFSTYAYRVFHKVDRKHDWSALAENSYEIIDRSSKENLNKSSSAKIPPDWILIDRTSGDLKETGSDERRTDFGFEATRVPFRLALDIRWFGNDKAKNTLSGFGFLKEQWDKENKIFSVYTHDGTSITEHGENAFTYAGVLGYFMENDAKASATIYENKLKIFYSAEKKGFEDGVGYYDSNWIWFAIGLYNNALPDLTDGVL